MKNTIRVERAKKRITQAELAKKVKSSRQNIHAIETEKSEPKTGLAMRIAKFFELEVNEIFQEDE